MLYVTLKWSDGYSAIRLSPRDSAIGRMILRYRAGLLLPLQAGFLDQIDERRRAAVHDRHFGRVELDDDVVDAHADERRQQMLDRFHRHLIARQARGELETRQMAHGRRQFEIAHVSAAEANAVIGWRRLERERDFAARMQADADAGN